MNTTKFVTVVVGSDKVSVAEPITRVDHGLRLRIKGVALPATYEVDFSNDEHSGSSVTMIGNSDGVLIPSQFIKSGKDVFAFLYHVGEDYGRTVFKFHIPNKLRPDRTDEEPTPEQASTIDQAINALNTAVEQTAQDVLDADASATSAAESAGNAAESASQAAQSASQASASATSAAQSTQQSSASASTASAAANNAAASAASAYADAERAEQAASTAGYLDVEIVDGRLIYTRTDAVDVDFALDNGRLIMEAI